MYDTLQMRLRQKATCRTKRAVSAMDTDLAGAGKCRGVQVAADAAEDLHVEVAQRIATGQRLWQKCTCSLQFAAPISTE